MKNYITPNFDFLDMIPVKGTGSVVWDDKNRDYIDFVGGIAVNALGHCHPRLLAALKDQAKNLWHCSNLYTNIPSQQLAEKLVTHTFAEKVFFANSGAEANEAALKLARRYAFLHKGAQKNKIISCEASFHGRSLFTVTVGGQKKYQQGFGPLPERIEYVPFNQTERLKEMLDDDTCAFIAEPIQGESGVISAHLEFLRCARELCNEHAIVFILDEVQTGMGRTGSLFAYQQYQVVPDILTTAKALGCGVPMGAMLCSEEVASAFTAGSHGTTMGGNPLCCAVANVAFDIINSQETQSHTKYQNERFVAELNQLAIDSGVFQSIRGKGLLLGCVLADAYRGQARELVQTMLSTQVMVSQAGPDVIRLTPSLLIRDQEREEGLKRMKQALEIWKLTHAST